MRKTSGRVAVVVATCLAVVPMAMSTASASRPASSRAVTPQIAASDWLGEANYLRSFWSPSGAVSTLTENATLSANESQLTHYLDENKTCTHTEDPSNPYYTAGGAYAGTHSAIYCTAAGPTNDVDGWASSVLAGEQVLNPQLTQTGFAESTLNGGHAAMDTLTNAAAGPAPTVPMTWPNGDDVPFSRYSGGELDSTNTNVVAKNCPSEYAKAGALGAPLFVDLPGAANATTSSYALTDQTSGTSVPACVFNAQSAVKPSVSTAILLPLNPLERGDSYTGQYTAGGQTGTWSFSVAVRPPSTPIEVDVLSNGNREATIGWTPPLDDGGARVTGYDVDYRAAGTSTWTQAEPDFTHDTATSQTVTGLTNGTSYVFRVAALNAVGASGYRVSTQSAVPAPTAPDAPTSVAGTAGNARIHLTWKAPANNGGKPITSYSISEAAAGHAYRAVPGTFTRTSATLTGLANGTSYRFKVAATSSLGTGAYSNASAPITPRADLPGAPQLVSALPAGGSATVSWLRPVSDGGGAITGYVVQYSSNGTSWTTAAHSDAATSRTVTGLANGTSYRFRVATVNASGTSAFASTVPAGSVTPGVSVPRHAAVSIRGTLSTSRFGHGVNVDCVATEGGKLVAKAPVAVLTRTTGSGAAWLASAVQLTSARGRAYIAIDPAHVSDVRCRTLGTDAHRAARSATAHLSVAPTVTFSLSRTKVRHGSQVIIRGSVSPAEGGRTIAVQKREHGHWRSLGAGITIAADGTYRTTLSVSGHGRIALRAYRSATTTNASSASPVVTLTIT